MAVILINIMKNQILLVDESLTVQKVVSLTLDKTKYSVSYARFRAEAIKQIVENLPEVILISDQVKDINITSFPKEVEAWLGRDHDLPAIILITGQNLQEVRHYTAVLKKPFTPQMLQSLVSAHISRPDSLPQFSAQVPSVSEDFEDRRLQNAFNDAFNDEKDLVRATFENQERNPDMQKPSGQRMESPGDLWGVGKQKPPELLDAEDSMAYKAQLETQVRNQLEQQDLEELVQKALGQLLPPIVERLVQERLDQLMQGTEQPTEAQT